MSSLTNPSIGQISVDPNTFAERIWTGTQWEKVEYRISNLMFDKLPTMDELEKHPTLKSTWEEYLAVRKLLGI